METYKQMADALNLQLLFCSKQKKDKPLHLKNAEELLESGAAVNYKNSRPLYFAVKNYNFPLVRLLIRYGALENDLSRKYLAAMCEKGAFNDKREEAFFQLLEFAVSKTGFDLSYLAPYINMTLVAGRIDKLCAAAEKFGLPLSKALSCVRLMIIFETVKLDRRESLRLIDSHTDWTEGAVDLAAATGQDIVLDYILSRGKNVRPSRESIIRAITAGYGNIIRVLDKHGIDLSDELFIKTACRGFARFPQPVAALADAGALRYGYEGKSVYDNALTEGNTELAAFLRTLKISEIY